MKQIIKMVCYSILRFFLHPYYISFIVAFFIMANYILPHPDLIRVSSDAQSIWQTIITFHNETITSSYVLYKGFLSVYPYVWLYDLSMLMGLDMFFFIKIYHCLLFAYAAGIGMPYIISKLLSIQLKSYRNIFFVIILFFLFEFTGVFKALMVDLPSWAFFVMAVSSVLKIEELIFNTPKWFFLFSGLVVGLCLCMSGQFFLAAFLLILFIVILLLSNIRESKKKGAALLMLFMLFVGVAIPKAYDIYFEKNIVQPMRERGDWLPTGSEWLMNGMTRFLPHYKSFSFPSIPSNRGEAIIKQQEGENFTEKYEFIKAGVDSYTVQEYFQLIKRNPFDFIMIWGTKMFLAISFDNGTARFSHLFVSYSSLFLCFFLIYRRFKTLRDVFKLKSLIPLSFIVSIAAPVFLQIEMRYAISLQGFIIGLALLDDFIWLQIKKNIEIIKQSFKTNQFGFFNITVIPYTLIFYLIFIIFCFLLYGSLLEISGSEPDSILFRF